MSSLGEPIHKVRPAAFVISLDFELHWGVRDFRTLDAAERARLLSARQVIPRLLALFDEFGIRATWATVGFLFARSKAELERFSPRLKPSYSRPELNPYSETVGADEAEDPFHFGASLIAEIARHAGQEIASHSFSHYYCLEAGQTLAQFRADLDSAVAIAAESGYAIRSYVFPRNQADPACAAELARAGLTCYRGAEPAGVSEPRDFHTQRRAYYRLGRLADAYLNLFGTKTLAWPDGPAPVSVAGSRYLAPYRGWLRPFESMRLKRIVTAMQHAAVNKEIFHLWWHPEDFACHCDLNVDFLRSILVAFERLRNEYGMQSLAMSEVAAELTQEAPASQTAPVTQIAKTPSKALQEVT